MNHLERMKAGLIYDAAADEIASIQFPYQDKLWEFNQLKPSHVKEKEAYMKENFAECGENCYIELPFHANWGGHHVHFGDWVYANSNLTCVDDGHIYVGSYTLMGPNVVLASAAHPINPELRIKGMEFNRDIHIGRNCWIGAGVIVLPGVTIGDNTVIGGGSVVTRDIPANVVAAGNPCRVLREITEHDREYYWKNEKIDWESLR